jgi:Fe-S cluster biogenesis protein NfuA
MEQDIVIYINSTNNPNCYTFGLNKIIIEYEFKVFHRLSKNIEESNLVCYLFEAFSEITEIFLKSNFISIVIDENFQISQNNLEAIKKTIYDFIVSDFSIVNEVYKEEFTLIQTCINEYINPTLEMEGGMFVIHKYSPKNKLLVIQTLGSCRNNPSISTDLEQSRNIINRVCNLDIKNVIPINLNY